MPSPSSKSSMSLGELTSCEDFLDGHREYAIDLLSSIEDIQQGHSADSCPSIREGRACALCELCSTNGLMGATKKALASYKDAENHLKAARTSLGESAPGRGAPTRETLFKNNLAKVVFFCIAAVGDDLRSQHETWQARLQSEVPSLSSSTQSSNAGPANLDENRNRNTLLPIYSGPKFVSPKLTVVSTGLVPETTSSSSLFLVFRRCLSSDCPCEANRTNVAANANFKGACGPQGTSQIPPSPLGSKKTCKPKAARSTTTNPQRHYRKTNDTSDTLVQTSQDVQPRCPDARTLDGQGSQDMTLEEHEPSSSASDTAWLTQETGSPSQSLEWEDPRLSCLRARIIQADCARRALMEWCNASIANLQLDPREKHRAGPSTRSTHLPTDDMCQVGEVDDETIVKEELFNSKQEDLKKRWLTARRKQFKERKFRRSALRELNTSIRTT